MRMMMLLLLALALPVGATTWPTCESDTWVVGNCAWCGAPAFSSTQRQFYERRGFFCHPTTRVYDWHPCRGFDPDTCSVADVIAGRTRQCRSAIGNHVTRRAENYQSDRIVRIERRMYACLSGHGL